MVKAYRRLRQMEASKVYVITVTRSKYPGIVGMKFVVIARTPKEAQMKGLEKQREHEELIEELIGEEQEAVKEILKRARSAVTISRHI